MRAGLALILTAGSALAGPADFVQPPLLLEEAGVFCPLHASGTEPAPDTQQGYIDLVEGAPRVDFALRVVPGELGMGFGIRYRLADPAGAATARIVVTHPPFGDPPVSRESWQTLIPPGGSQLSAFSFETETEIRYGTWTMEVEVDGAVRLRQSFEVVPTDRAPVRLAQCEGPAVTS